MTKELIELTAEYSALRTNVHKRLPHADLVLLDAAWEFTKLAHGEVRRKSGELYAFHPLRVATILNQWELDVTTMIAGLLHDTIEDGGATREDLVQRFGEDVAVLVDGVTKVSNLRLKGSVQDTFVESLRKMILVMARDLRVVFVKLADRTHNMRTLAALPPNKQERIARETLEVFAPLSERLGMGLVKAELEDLAFPFLYPDQYKKLVKEAQPFYATAKEHTEKMTRKIQEVLKEENINADVYGRQKHLYSLWKKLGRAEIGGSFSEIHDIVALRILVDRVPDCYATLGLVHMLYKPAPNIGISDFIAQPKPNGYRSIHTKVFGPEGRIVEVQIRTHAMHEQAERGAAAHWAYSDAKAKNVSDTVLEAGGVVAGNKLDWVRELVEWQKQISNAEEFLKVVKFDAFQERNFVFSPKGDVFDLPEGATPIDFAYAVHTKLGSYIQGALVNGKMVPLHYQLKSGDVVEILKSKLVHIPSQDWLKFVVTNTARRAINRSFHAK